MSLVKILSCLNSVQYESRKKKSTTNPEANKCQINVSLNTLPVLLKLKAIRGKSVLMRLKV